MLGGHHSDGGAQVEHGSIGWDGEDDYFFPGEETNDGLTLVRVQLFRGRDVTKPLTKRAQGVKLVCLVPDGEFRVPPKDARCWIAIPQGMDNVPGAGLLLGTVSGGNTVRTNITPGDTTIAPTGDNPGQATVLVKQDGTVTIHTAAGNKVGGRSVFFRVGPDAFEFVAPWGTLKFDAAGFHLWTASGDCNFDMGGIQIPGIPADIAALFASYITLTAGVVRAKGTSVFLGAGQVFNPVIATPIDPSNPPPHAAPPLTLAQLLQSGGVYAAP